jgi:hypothetical protein
MRYTFVLALLFTASLSEASSLFKRRSNAMKPVNRKAIQNLQEDPLHPDNFLSTPIGIGARADPDSLEYIILSDEEVQDAVWEAEQEEQGKRSWISKVWKKIRAHGWFGMKPVEERMRNIIRLQ